MKKTDITRKTLIIRISVKKHESKLKRKNKPYRPIGHVASQGHKRKAKRNYKLIKLPTILCLKTNYKETSDFLVAFRKNYTKTKTTIILDFENCQKITPPAMLLLLAEVHRGRLLRGVNAITGTYPKNHTLLKRMCDTGFFELLEIKSPLSSAKTFPMEYIKFRSGTKLVAESARQLRESLLGENIKMKIKPRNQLQRGVSEAMLNALQHAYPETHRDFKDVGDRWWLTGHYHQPTRNLSIMFCDLGVGIPATLPRKHTAEHLRSFISVLPGVKPDDGAMIFAGMRVGRSSTQKQHRGKGLNDLRGFIDKAGAGELKIYSRAGEYSYTSSNEEPYKTNDTPVQGTLIVWTVPIHLVTEGLRDENDDDCTV